MNTHTPMARVAFLLVLILSMVGCYPALKKEVRLPAEALDRVRFFKPRFEDDLPLESLAQALRRNLEYLDRLPGGRVFNYATDTITSAQVREGQRMLLAFLERGPSAQALARFVRKHFRIYKMTGRYGRGKVLVTGYFEPTFEARLKPDDVYRFPLYRRPEDLQRLDLSLFHPKFRGESIVVRVDDNQRVLPYYSRAEIEARRVLQGRGLEIAWLKDPVDVAFLHIQGSGRLRLQGGRVLRVGYHAANGRPYRSIGKYLLEQGWMKAEEMSMQSIRAFLRQHPDVVEDVLNRNPSYIFFRITQDGPYGSLNVPLTPGRSLALDHRLFPKGALAFIASRKPLMESPDRISRWVRFSRFVLVQDTGGAIRGAGRADLFWGHGAYAELAAGHMKEPGKIYCLVKR